MEFASTFDVGGSLTVLRPIIKRIYIVIRKNKLKKDAQDQLKQAIPAIQKLENEIEILMVSCGEVRQLLEKASDPVDAVTADKVWVGTTKALGNMTNVFTAFRQFVYETTKVTTLEQFMSHLKLIDSRAYDGLNLFSRSYKDGKVDLSGYPAFIAVYGPKKKEQEKLKHDAYEVARPVIRDTTRKAKRMPLPHRVRDKTLRKAISGLVDESENFTYDGKDVLLQFEELRPEWMQDLADAATQAIEDD